MNGEVLRGEVYWLKDRDSIGAEERLRRPVVIVSSKKGNETSPAVIGVSMTSKYRWGKINVPVRVTDRTTYAMCNQIYCLDKSRLDGYIGAVSDAEMAEIETGLKIAMDLFDNDVDSDEIASLEDEISQLKTEIETLKEKLATKDTEIEVRCDTYKKLYEKALEEFVALKFSKDSEKMAPPVEAVVEEKVEVEGEPPVVEEEPPKLVEINSCTINELRAIGVDAVLANNIIEGRPYEDIEDVKFVPGMKSLAYNLLKSRISVTPVGKAKLNINTITLEEMVDVVGIPHSIAVYVRAYRNKNGAFKKVEDLLNVPRFSTRLYSKVASKLEV